MRCDSGGKLDPMTPAPISTAWGGGGGGEEFRFLSMNASLRAQRGLDKQQLACQERRMRGPQGQSSLTLRTREEEGPALSNTAAKGPARTCLPPDTPSAFF